MSNLVKREQLTFTPGAVAALYGSSAPLFDMHASDAIMSLSFAGRYSPLFDWLGFEPTKIFRVHEYFISYIAADGAAAGTPTDGWITDPCAPGETVEWGSADFAVEGFGRIRRRSPVRELTEVDLRYSEAQPVYRIDGSLITDELEWDYYQVTSAMVQDLHRMLILGNKTTAGQFDGLQRLVNYGYTTTTGAIATEMDSIVIDYNGNSFAPAGGATGVTFNGNPITDGYNFIDILKSVVNRIQTRVRMAPTLNAQLQNQDMALVLPQDWIDTLLDAYTCYTVCGNDVTRMDSFEARNYRASLAGGGMFNAGVIRIHGIDISLLPYDFELNNGDGTCDMYLLTRGAGNTPFLRGQFNDLSTVSKGDFTATDRGLLMTWETTDHTCYQRHAEAQLRLVARAPWAQARFANVGGDLILGSISGDPLSSVFIEQNLVKMV